MNPIPFDVLKQRIEKLGELYTLPSVLLEILVLCDDANSSSRDISKCVERDQAIAMKVLRVANSAYTGLRQRVSSIPLAVHLLGPREVLQIATSVSVFEFVGSKYKDPRLNLGTLWLHVMQTAAVAGLLSDRLGRASTGAEFAAGLLHDIGKVVMAQEFPDQLDEILAKETAEGISSIDAETAVLGATHATLGGWLAAGWELPQRLVDAIAYHHEPMAALAAHPATDDPALSAIVYLADMVSQPEVENKNGCIECDPAVLDTAQQLLVLEHPDIDTESLAAMLGGIGNSLEYADQFRADVEAAETGGDYR